jgi:Na+/H+ antiporter NhaD/arsenite permease-like protein
MIETLMIIVFVLGYLAIALEHKIKVDKAATALLIGGIGWSLLAFGIFDIINIETVAEKFKNFQDWYSIKSPGKEITELTFLKYELSHHLTDIAEILFFLLGAMTIVELIDAHQGFSIITDRITTNKKVALMWILSLITFFLSAALDNLTTAIVMSALITKLIKEKEDLWMFAGMIILAANSGGAWSPIGDITTIMLWIGGQITAANVITNLFIPSLVCMLAPLIYLSFRLKGNVARSENLILKEHEKNPSTHFQKNLVFYLGVFGLLFVPIFKTVTHLPPYIGMLISLAILWLTTEIIHRSKNHEQKSALSVIGVLKKVDVPTIFFFLGILLAVASLESAGQLKTVAQYLNTSFNGQTAEGTYIINIIIGFLSSIVDNVPLVAGAMGMYPIAETGLYAVDGIFWEFLAYCAGTGGSILIIGSASGVAVMGILKIDFIWYLKNIAFLAIMGYLAGAVTYILMQ